MSFYNQKISFDHLSDSALISETIRQLDHKMHLLSIDPKITATRLVFCEELMLSYAEKGFQEMTLSLKGRRKHPSLELCIPGEKQNCFEWYSDNRGNTMQEEIKACVRQQLFDSGAFWAEYKYAHRKNMIRIQLSDKEEKLSQAVTQLYQEHGEELKQKPLLLFREIIRMDPIRCIATV